MTICTLTRQLRILLLGGIALLCAVNEPVYAAPASFELDLKELESPGQHKKRPPARPAAPQPPPAETSSLKSPTEPDEREVTRYTVKPGDFIFKILIRDFGLTNAQAEALIPEIQRLNKLQNIRRLEVGQTLLIPRAMTAAPAPRKTVRQPALKTEAGVAAPTSPPPAATPAARPQVTADLAVSSPAAPAQPAPAPTEQGPKPTALPPSFPAPIAQPAEQTALASTPAVKPHLPEAKSLAAQLLTFWEDLVPGQRQIEPINFSGKLLDPEEFPILLAADGSKMLVDLRGTLSPQAKSQLLRKYPDLRVVTRGKEELRDFVGSLLRVAEFPRLEERPKIDLGADPRLTLTFDFRIVRIPTSSGGPEPVYMALSPDGPCLPSVLKESLASRGFRVAELCAGVPTPHAEPGYELRSVAPLPPCDMAQVLIEALSLKLEKNRIISGVLGGGTDNRFSIRVEGYFENSGRRYILACGDHDPYHYTLMRLLQIQGYRLITVQDRDDFAAVASNLFTQLNYPHIYGRHELDYDHFTISVTGFKVTRTGDTVAQMLITTRPSDPMFTELVKWGPKRH